MPRSINRPHTAPARRRPALRRPWHEFLPAVCADPALRALTPANPLLLVTALPRDRHKRICNALQHHVGRPVAEAPEFPVRVAGVGRTARAHYVTRNDLLDAARVAFLGEVGPRVLSWAQALMHGIPLPQEVPTPIRATVALRRAVMVARLFQVMRLALPASRGLPAEVIVRRTATALAELLVRSASVLSREGGGTFATSLEHGGVVINLFDPSAFEVRTGAITASALVADFRASDLFEATVRPTKSRTPAMAAITRWERSTDSLDRVAAACLRRAWVGLADDTGPELAIAESRSAAWGVAALACWPSEDTLEAAHAASRAGQFGGLPEWSRRQIERGLVATPVPPLRQRLGFARLALSPTLVCQAVEAAERQLCGID